METKVYTKEYAGKPLTVTLGKLAQQANGSCLVQYGETTVLVTATMSGPRDTDYFPLTVAYEERYYAAGKIKGSKWIKRETRPSDEAILSGRVIDRALRPRFDSRVRNEIQVIATVFSFDGENDPDIPAIFGSSLALMISDIPFDGPIGGVRVGRIDGKLVFNPNYEQRKQSDFDILVAGTANKMNMLEAGLNIVSEEDTADAISKGFETLQTIIQFQNEIYGENKLEKQEAKISEPDAEFAAKVREFIAPKLEERMYGGTKQDRKKGMNTTKEEMEEFVKNTFAEDPDFKTKLKETETILEQEVDRIVHENIVKSEKRLDGRKIDEIRELNAEIGALPRSHGSAIFNRGATQALSILTLASPGMEQWVETMEMDLTKKRFMHHYVFPPFCVGETGRVGFPGRREIGHGALAEKALLPLIPSKEDFPYTIQVVSEILSSNGSSSMASVCGSTLALMDGGVPIKSPAAGIAMGLMLDKDGNNHKVLTDIQGPEDHYGDMDLKVAGTKDGITALQMDVKVEGIDHEILLKTLKQASKARMEILEVITKVIGEPRKELSARAPKIITLNINPEKIGLLIGPHGKTINGIIDKTGVNIDIEDDGMVFVTSEGGTGDFDAALKMINAITYEPKAGDEFEGKVTRLLDFGAFVEYMPDKEGLVHVSEISREKRINKPSDVLKVGQSVHVSVKNVDEYGRINLTMLTKAS
ncbi:MAG: polyribonucleotide nucleotidyltransferase [Parcubacteria group bacterium]